jgi:glutamine amidotransferase-like uncharacterized protein
MPVTLYEYCQNLNHHIRAGEKVSLDQWLRNRPNNAFLKRPDRKLRYPRLGIFNGKGSSHSWLWYVDLFERMGFYDLVFLDETRIQRGDFQGIDGLAVSGGDTLTMAEALGSAGALHLGSYIRQGGLYLGSCAGAYLPLNSSKEHLNLFNFVEARITNLTAQVPPSITLPQKSITPYGCSFIFHPVREEVALSTVGVFPFTYPGTFPAPLYGGPGLLADEPCQVLARYSRFTPKTRFLVDQALARETLLGKGAVIRKNLGQGCLYLFGPHFEHPYFPVANKILTDVLYWELSKEPASTKPEPEKKNGVVFQGQKLNNLLKPLKREISNARIVAQGLEMTSLQWVIGNKVYEPVKIRIFLEAIWKRIGMIEKKKFLLVSGADDRALGDKAKTITNLVRRIKQGFDAGQDTGPLAVDLFERLQTLTRSFLTLYFRSETLGSSGESLGIH